MKKHRMGLKVCVASMMTIGIVVGALYLEQKETVEILYSVANKSPEHIQREREVVKVKIEEVLSQYGVDSTRIALEEELQMTEQTLSVEEKPQIHYGEDRVKQDESEIVASYTAKMYTLQAKYTGQLQVLESEGWELLDAYSSETQTVSQLMPQGMKLVSKAMSLQSQCDEEVNEVLRELTEALEDINADTEVVEVMRIFYETEKSAQISYYMSLIPKF